MFSAICTRNLVRQTFARCSLAYLPTPVSVSSHANGVKAQLTTHKSTGITGCRQFHINSRLYNQKEFSNSFNIQDTKDFEERVLQSPNPIIVDFHAEWCGPCKILGPRLDTEVDKHNGKVLLAKVDVDDHGITAMKYKVMAVPTVCTFKNGEIVDRFEGNLDDKSLEAFVTRSYDTSDQHANKK